IINLILLNSIYYYIFFLFYCFFFFFFQAEDGIRDGHVTGVQTCALPISILMTSSSTGSAICWHSLPGVSSCSILDVIKMVPFCRKMGFLLLIRKSPFCLPLSLFEWHCPLWPRHFKEGRKKRVEASSTPTGLDIASLVPSQAAAKRAGRP